MEDGAAVAVRVDVVLGATCEPTVGEAVAVRVDVAGGIDFDAAVLEGVAVMEWPACGSPWMPWSVPLEQPHRRAVASANGR